MPHILVRPDNKISILLAADNSGAEEALRVSQANGWEYVGEFTIPESRYFRNCWVWDSTNSAVIVDISSAVAQKMEEIRAQRDKLLADSDGLMARANEVGTQEEIAALKTYRQSLRGLPEVVEPIISQITDPNSLEAFSVSWPTI